MQYDVASKRVLELGGAELLQELLGMPISRAKRIESLPGESATLRSSDYVFRVKRADGSQAIVLLELQTKWSAEKALRLAEYSLRFRERYSRREGGPEIIPCMLLFLPHVRARSVVRIPGLTFRFNLFKLWELDGRRALDSGSPGLLPFLPLMRGGTGALEQAQEKIYGAADLSRAAKADLLTSMAIFTGLKAPDLALQLINRRRDIMIESPVYEWLREDARKEVYAEAIAAGREQGLAAGRAEGHAEGHAHGRLEIARRMADSGVTREDILRWTGLSDAELREAGIETT